MICNIMAGQYPRILNILKINRKIYNTSKLKYPINNNYYKNSFTTKYLINKYSNLYYKHKETVLKNRSLYLK